MRAKRYLPSVGLVAAAIVAGAATTKAPPSFTFPVSNLSEHRISSVALRVPGERHSTKEFVTWTADDEHRQVSLPNGIAAHSSGSALFHFSPRPQCVYDVEVESADGGHFTERDWDVCKMLTLLVTDIELGFRAPDEEGSRPRALRAVADGEKSRRSNSRAYTCTDSATHETFQMMLGSSELRIDTGRGWGNNYCGADMADRVSCGFQGSKFVANWDGNVEFSYDPGNGAFFWSGDDFLSDDSSGTCRAQ